MMETWTLFWTILLLPNNAGVDFYSHSTENLTHLECNQLLEEMDLKLVMDSKEQLIAGHEIYCARSSAKAVSLKKDLTNAN